MSFKIPRIQIRRQHRVFISESNFHNLLDAGHIVINVMLRGTFVCSAMTKHEKEATIEFINCRRVDDSCFAEDGFRDMYCPEPAKRFIFQDAQAEDRTAYSSIYYTDEIVTEREE
jgi:hypothetical protein